MKKIMTVVLAMLFAASTGAVFAQAKADKDAKKADAKAAPAKAEAKKDDKKADKAKK